MENEYGSNPMRGARVPLENEVKVNSNATKKVNSAPKKDVTQSDEFKKLFGDNASDLFKSAKPVTNNYHSINLVSNSINSKKDDDKRSEKEPDSGSHTKK